MNVQTITEITSCGKVEEFPNTQFAEFAFWGRSNVGKSTLLNQLVNNNSIAKVSKNPGKTRRIYFYEVDTNDEKVFVLVDMPGYGYAKVSKEKRAVWEKLMADYALERFQLQTLFLLIDASIPPQKIDIEMVNRLTASRIPFSIVFTKIDKNNSKNIKETVESIKKLSQAKTFQTSSIKKDGIAEISQYINNKLEEIS